MHLWVIQRDTKQGHNQLIFPVMGKTIATCCTWQINMCLIFSPGTIARLAPPGCGPDAERALLILSCVNFLFTFCYAYRSWWFVSLPKFSFFWVCKTRISTHICCRRENRILRFQSIVTSNNFFLNVHTHKFSPKRNKCDCCVKINETGLKFSCVKTISQGHG